MKSKILTSKKIPLKSYSLKINYKFKNENYIVRALTHSSFNEKNENLNYERLEFLGDRVLGLVISELIYKRFPREKEGELSKRFSELVSKKTLAIIAKEIKLDEMILTSKEHGLKIKVTDSMLADSLEALIGAIFLDSDFIVVKKIVSNLWYEKIKKQLLPPDNPKSFLQEWCLRENKNTPIYKLKEKIGPDHEPTFLVEVNINDFIKTKASGKTKQEAEIRAAQKIIEKLIND